MTYNLIRLLEGLAKRPENYVGIVNFDTVRAYLHGLSAGCGIAGIEYSFEEYFAAAKARGWDPRGSIGIVSDFRRKKLTDEEMVRELIAVETDAYTRALARLGKVPSVNID